MSIPIRIGISACVLGEKVRRDGTHAREPYITDELAKYVEFVPLCPELACGMGLPRDEFRMVDCAGDIRLIGKDTGEDWTQRIGDCSGRLLASLKDENLSGFILKSRSATCGLHRGQVYSTTGKAPHRGTGFFTRRLMDKFPILPLETGERLLNPIIRENFIRRVFVLKRWKEMRERSRTIGHLVDFHTRHKLLIRAHDLRGYRQLGHLLGESSVFNTDEIFDAYAKLLFQSLKLKATLKKNADVLMHAMGYFKRELGSEDKQELLSHIFAYKGGKIPLLIPVTLINHYARKFDKQYLQQQLFFNPDNTELKLLNHV